jgi:hypothetical protein
MILVGYSWVDVGLGILYVSLAVVVVAIGYKKLLAYLGKGGEVKKDFCVLYPLEMHPAKGELEFYFTTETERDVKLLILDAEMNEFMTVVEKRATEGGNIVRFDSTKLGNGTYFFCLLTENQRTMKKMVVKND